MFLDDGKGVCVKGEGFLRNGDPDLSRTKRKGRREGILEHAGPWRQTKNGLKLMQSSLEKFFCILEIRL